MDNKESVGKENQEDENKILALKAAIQDGIDSGIAHDFDPENVLEMLHSRKRKAIS